MLVSQLPNRTHCCEDQVSMGVPQKQNSGSAGRSHFLMQQQDLVHQVEIVEGTLIE